MDLNIASGELDRAYDLLASDEKARAACFAFAVHRRRFVAARAALREVLGVQLDLDARDLVFRYTPEGKPELADHPGLQFSVSHSADLCLIAVARGVRVGIDIEAMAGNQAQMQEVIRSFHPVEREALNSIDPALRKRAFYRCWVRKEAFLKALGVGLGGGLKRFHVSLGHQAQLLGSDPALATASDWTLVAMDGEGYAAAMAIEGARCRRPAAEDMDCASSPQ
ncbi:MAG: 4'-phosphopantetheinyl transferase superfamily protein [Pseudomonadota bacterium]